MTPTIERTDDGHRLTCALEIPRPLDEVFPFFADARNLERITPPHLRFRILTPEPIEMHEGLLIDYRISLRGIPMRWRSEITAWEPPHRFVDEQRRGPYARWIHEHRFEARGDVTIATDTVDYDVRGPGLLHALLVRPDLERIFRYRAQTLADIFATPAHTTTTA